MHFLNKKNKGLLFCLTLLTSACSTHTIDPYIGDNPSYIYAIGHRDLQHGNNNGALTAYQSLDSQYPFNPYTQKGDLDSIYAYYDNDDPAMALTAASRYIKVYPEDSNADYANYMMGVVDFENGRGFLQKYFPYTMDQHNPANYTMAFNYFNTLITQYPNSIYTHDARHRMIYLNDTLAQYELNVAYSYYQQAAYVAAIHRAQNVIIHYPTTPQTEGALQLMIESYKQLGLSSLAESTTRVLALNFLTASTQYTP
jgi:outer membrane protein assembly factor BamD